MTTGLLKAGGWKSLASEYPDPGLISAVLGICKFGARIGYERDHYAVTIYANLAMAVHDSDLMTADIEAEWKKGRLEKFDNLDALRDHYTASPLGLTDKADGSKRRIHHLAYPAEDTASINSGIPDHYGTITYSTIDDAMKAIQKYGRNCQLVEHDFESAFRHIPVSPLDVPLLGFEWQSTYCAERFLPFGLQTAPYLFNIFAEVFHWILNEELRKNALAADVIHYLDDFLIVLPATQSPAHGGAIFATTCHALGLSIKESKNEEGKVASFGGVELYTGRMVVRLPSKKLEKARAIVSKAMEMTSFLLLDLQKITGYLNFIAIVVPLGRTFLRRLYNIELYFPRSSRN